MTTPENREKELKIQQMEAEIYRQSQSVDIDPPFYQTKKHNSGDSYIKKLGKKIVKFAKFGSFVIGGVAIIKIGFFIGMWVTYLIMTGIIAAIGYQIFLKEDR